MEKEIKQLSQVFEPWENGVILETMDGAIASWNKGAQDLYGYSADEVIGREHSFLVPSDANDNMLEALKKVRQGEPNAHQETIHMRKDGSRVNVSLTISPLRNESGSVIAFSILVDNTSERDQEKILFNALTQSSPIGICIVREGKFRYINRQFETIIGYNINELLETATLSYVHAEDRALVRNNAITALKSGVCQPYEYRVLTKSGKIKWILETVISIRYQGKRSVLGNFMDITEIKRLEEETNRANERLTMVVNKLEEQQRQNTILTEMRGMLQACLKMEETAPIIMGCMKNYSPNHRVPCSS
jgi:PAS domain S-box-containing protein